jgi:hypothetical protein
LIQLDGAGVGVVNLVVGGLLYLGVYLTLAPILGAVEKQDILNLRNMDSRGAGEISVRLRIEAPVCREAKVEDLS